MIARTWLVVTLMAGVTLAQAPGARGQERQKMTSLSGRTIRWTFVDGPTAGATFEHTLNPDGSIVWRAVDGAFKGATRREKLYGAVRINDQTWAVSYLAESGHTLTVVLDFASHKATGFASNEKTWHQVNGTFDVVN
jgi:molybdenum cofactor biosynthesis protein MoaF